MWVGATAGDQVIARRRRRLDLTTDGLAKCIRYPPSLADLRCLVRYRFSDRMRNTSREIYSNGHSEQHIGCATGPIRRITTSPRKHGRVSWPSSRCDAPVGIEGFLVTWWGTRSTRPPAADHRALPVTVAQGTSRHDVSWPTSRDFPHGRRLSWNGLRPARHTHEQTKLLPRVGGSRGCRVTRRGRLANNTYVHRPELNHLLVTVRQLLKRVAVWPRGRIVSRDGART